MTILSLDIENFRNIQPVSVDFSEELNLISGNNASGKTSFLEALFFLGRSRSFRTRQVTDLIHYGEESFRLFGRSRDNHRAGLQRSANTLTLRIDGQPAGMVTELLKIFPVLALHPYSHRLLQEGPGYRRRFMDWGIFYGNADFVDHWRRFQRALKHRNAALRQKMPDRMITVWNDELQKCAEFIDQCRNHYCRQLQDCTLPLIDELIGKPLTFALQYRRGWPKDLSLNDILIAELDKDRKQGFTRHGPQRGDFSVLVNTLPARDNLSHGQQKLVVIALTLAQALLYRQHTGFSCSLLIDDLAAELDSDHRQRVIDCLKRLQCQCFITAIEESLLDFSSWSGVSHFRVDQGVVKSSDGF